LDDDMEIESSEPLEEPMDEEWGAYILEFVVTERQNYISHPKAKKCRMRYWLLGPIKFVSPPREHNRKLEAKLGAQFISSRWRQKVVHVVPRR